LDPLNLPETNSSVTQEVVSDHLETLLEILPPILQSELRSHQDLQSLIEVVLDLGRPPLVRFRDRELLPNLTEVTSEDIAHVVSRIGSFGDDNRAGIERTLHRISCLRNRNERIIGLTCRVGRAVFGTIKIIEDLVTSGSSILLLGRPGVGKTTMLREIARVLADDVRKRVVVVDTSNEIAGDGDIPHPAIGKSRRMQVKSPSLQHAVMTEAVENHMPEVIVIDEMGTELEAAAARTIAERGVQLIATAHGNTLDNLIMNPTLSDLVGGIQTVILGDEEARRRGTQKSVLERKAPPCFDVVVEIQGWNEVAVHPNVTIRVDTLLRGYKVTPELRWINTSGDIQTGHGLPISLAATPIRSEENTSLLFANDAPMRAHQSQKLGGSQSNGKPDLNRGNSADHSTPSKVHKLYCYGVSRERLEQTIRYFGIGAQVVSSIEDADTILTTKVHYRKRPDLLKAVEQEGKQIFVLRRNTPLQLEQFLKTLSSSWASERQNRLAEGLEEAEEAVNLILNGGEAIELEPQRAYVRRLQHVLAERYNLGSASTGRDPGRRVIIFHP